MNTQSTMAPKGAIQMRVMRNGSFAATPARELSLWEIFQHGFPHFGLSWQVALWRLKNLPHLIRGLWRVLIARVCHLSNFYGVVSLTVLRGDGSVLRLGIASLRVVTTAGVNYLVDALQNSVEPENFKYHGFGTGGTAEAAGDTALVTELTTEYATDSTRPTGTQTEGASANIYRSVATLSPDGSGTLAITEHGIFSQAATGGGTLLDRSLFSAVNLVRGSDSLQATYDLTIAAGS